jgi:hypothetical protein
MQRSIAFFWFLRRKSRLALSFSSPLPLPIDEGSNELRHLRSFRQFRGRKHIADLQYESRSHALTLESI